MVIRSGLLSVVLMVAPSVASAAPLVCSFNPSAAWCETCGVSADVNEDGVVDGVDLGLVLGSWGQVPASPESPPELPKDFNQDGTVDCFDQKFILGNWGDCVEVETDLTDDGKVDLSDVEVLLEAYGTCSHMVPPCNEELPLDLDNNGWIDQNDVDIVGCYIGRSIPTVPDVDFNRDGQVTAADQQIVQEAAGPTGQKACPYDLNQNGLVEWTDIKVLIKRGAA